ncbi:2-oxoglutarate and iron-dependent oxygenase domain-containing protein 2 [Geodia barretti]|uniref:2-oxoglutarate and iron-dependent oxygenase domain-containing protein 2 n=1 Tax=Geodia barretti TaxID=519541 RepID=A0AA35WS58_GEOBA|nr:2-oxoglutarate and iron-dependent oxygenase domain-containing protein 2 [Geodia barretti]
MTDSRRASSGSLDICRAIGGCGPSLKRRILGGTRFLSPREGRHPMLSSRFCMRYGLHCVFLDDDQFGEDYRALLREKGCASDQEYDEVLKEVHGEVERRRKSSETSKLRVQTIQLHYQRLHPQIYTLSVGTVLRWSVFLEIVKYCRSDTATPAGLLDIITEEEVPNVYSFPVLTEEFGDLLLQELEHFDKSKMPKGRPNSMNNYGILLSELGFDRGFLDHLREDYLTPLASLLYPEWVGHLDWTHTGPSVSPTNWRETPSFPTTLTTQR